MHIASKTFVWALAGLLLFTGLNGCKEKEDPEDITDQLCDGTGSADFLPLVNENYWEWKQDASYYVKHFWQIAGTAEFNGNTYLKMQVSYNNGDSQVERYFRRSTSGDVYEYSTYYDSTGQEFMYLPAQPVVGNEWNFPVIGSTAGNGSRKAVSVNESFSTQNCNGYSDLLKVEEYTAPGQLYGTYWYKKGLGLVRWRIAVVNSDLVKVSLK